MIQLIKTASSVVDNLVPFRASKIYVVNAPSWFGAVWVGLRKALPATIQSKVDVVALDALRGVVDFPAEYGGALPLGQHTDELAMRDAAGVLNAGRALVFAPPSKVVVTAPLPPPPPVLRTLEDFLPLTLFYDNDQPDPRTRRAVTKRTYEDTYFDYLRREDEYYEEYAENQSEQDALAQFFEDEVAEGYERLELFSTILLEQLEAGQQVEIFLKGYTSPRAQGDYNLLLGKRRVSAVRNHFENWRTGTLVEYLDSGQLIISEVSFGETKAAASAQDERAGERLSIYSPEAARERRVEIVEIKRGQ